MDDLNKFDPFGPGVRVLEKKLNKKNGLWDAYRKMLDLETGAIYYERARDSCVGRVLAWLLPDMKTDNREISYPRSVERSDDVLR